jgi:dTDP-4-dehydrorhamnose reductase
MDMREGQRSVQRETILVTGAGGQLGGYLRRSLESSGYGVMGVGRQPGAGVDIVADISNPDRLDRTLEDTGFDAVIHAAAYTDVDGCETSPELANRVNRIGSRNVARLANTRNAWLVGVSTDFVFSGDEGPYVEDAAPGPISVYGESKLRGEVEILSTNAAFAIARTSWVYGGPGKHFPRTVLTTLARRGGMSVVDDERGSPTFAGDLATALVQMLPHRPSGGFHLSNDGSVSRFAFAREITHLAGLDPEVIRPISTPEFLEIYPLPARRPANSTLLNTRAVALGIVLPSWQASLAGYIPVLAQEVQNG